MGISIFGIAAKDTETLVGREGKEEALNRLLNTTWATVASIVEPCSLTNLDAAVVSVVTFNFAEFHGMAPRSRVLLKSLQGTRIHLRYRVEESRAERKFNFGCDFDMWFDLSRNRNT